MNKLIILSSLAALASLSVNAESKKGTILMKSPASYQVLGVSQNGEWASGDYYDEYADVNYGFRWNLLTDKIEMLGGACTVYTVANDGTVCGSHYVTNAAGNSTETGFIWKDGQWTDLEAPNSYGFWAYAISPDGHYVTGTDNKYVSYIWKDGKLAQTCTVTPPTGSKGNGTFITYCISQDGTKAGGWSYFHNDNRNPGYWDSADKQFHDLNLTQGGSPWQAVKKFSADGNKALFWGGYHIDPKAPEKGYGIKAIYNIDTQDTTYIYPTYDDPFNFDFYDMNDDATTVVGYQQDNEGAEHGIIWNNGKTQYIESYFNSIGITFSDDEMYPLSDTEHYIARGMCVDGAAKTHAILYWDNDLEYHTMIVALDREMSMTPPVNLEATQVAGLQVADLEWDEPLGDKSTLKGYNIYRDGAKINEALVDTTMYYDTDLAYGSYTYKISAVYEEGESAKSDSANVTIAEPQIQGPQNLAARQKGYKSAFAMWDAPKSNLTDINYYGDETSMDAFGGGSVSFESGTLFPVEQMNLYAGYKLRAVSFYPKTQQGSWLVNVYTHENGKLKSLGSFKVTQELNYGEQNTVTLSRPITLQKDHDLLIGIQTNVTNSSYDIQGVYENRLKIGYTDLVRQVGESNFYSVNEMGSTTYDMAWATDALLAPPTASAGIDSINYYNVYIDNAQAPVQTTELTYEDNTLENGNHTLAVSAVYNDGRESAQISTPIYVHTLASALKAITPNVTVAGNEVSATWETPKDDDATDMGYCNNIQASKMPKATDDVTQILARVDFEPAKLKSYVGYQIDALKFVPMSDASFTVEIYEDDKCLASIEPEDLTFGEWNTVKLEEPFTIQKNKTYHFVVGCFDCPSGEAPLAIDSRSAVGDYSNYIQAGGESDWYTIYEESGISGNWMMRIGISDANAKEFLVDGYNVYCDANLMSEKQYALTYSQQVPSSGTVHTLRVDALYNGVAKAVTGNSVTFKSAVDGINEVNSEKSDLKNNTLYNVNGQRVHADAKGIVISKGKKLLAK